jgi:hypothetical protein
MFWEAIPVIGKVAEKIVGAIDKCVEDKDLAAKLKADFNLELMQSDFSYVQKELESQAAIVAAEAQGKSFLQRNWRPILMLTFTYIIAHNYVLSPMFSLTRLEIPPDMWELLKLGMGGYIIGRSVEKAVSAYKS